jgi:hypothetical protein
VKRLLVANDEAILIGADQHDRLRSLSFFDISSLLAVNLKSI